MSERVNFSGLVDIISSEQAAEYDDDEKLAAEHKLISKAAPLLLKKCFEDNLTNTQKCYIMLYYKQSMTIPRIAEIFGVNKATVSRTINRGRQRLLRAIRCETLKKSMKKGALN